MTSNKPTVILKKVCQDPGVRIQDTVKQPIDTKLFQYKPPVILIPYRNI